MVTMHGMACRNLMPQQSRTEQQTDQQDRFATYGAFKE
jgi:hypothetical protein